MKSILSIVFLLVVLALTVIAQDPNGAKKPKGLFGKGRFGGKGKAGKVVDPNQGKVVDPNQGKVVDPNQGKVVDPNQGKVVDPNQGKAGKVVDPNQGKVLDPNQGKVFDPNQGKVADPNQGNAAPVDSNDSFADNSLSGDANPQVCNVSKLSKTNGIQRKDGSQSCADTQIGEIPSVNQMVSTIITAPANGQTLPANTKFTITAKSVNLDFGNFDNPDTEYYKFSQQLNKQGLIKGHQHVVVQQLNGNNVLDPKTFSFFKGLNQEDNNGAVSIDVTDGLPAGKYRLCTLTSSFAHASVIMPVAQRGAQDDCIRFGVN